MLWVICHPGDSGRNSAQRTNTNGPEIWGQIQGGSGSDTLIGGSGDDTISDAAGNNSITGGLGSDSITAGTGQDTIQFGAGDARTGATVFTDTITGFTVGANGDLLRIGIGDLDGSAATLTASDSTGTDIAAISAAVVQSVSTGQILTITATANVIKFSSTASSSFSSAIGSGAVTFNVGSSGDFAVGAIGTGTTEAILGMFYDATNSRAVVGLIFNTAGQSGAALNTLDSNDTFTNIALIGMTAADYANFNANNIIFGG